MGGRTANRLASETSPYLLQHAHNPVDWYPWGAEALERARRLDRPILLSIGYAACHWCHVMERESFEDELTAALMNDHFVPIKVDREERPDLDSLYMDAVQAMTGSGGWPLTAFLTPEGAPFFAGTYFPPEPRHGLPAFRQVLEGVTEAWENRRDDLRAQGSRVVDAIGRAARTTGSHDPLSDDVLREAFAQLSRIFDPRWGGFGGAPKFPQPMTLEFLLRVSEHGEPGARDMVITTLDRMADGGIYDHLGGGFARYSTDAEWFAPHFEKMLYDNAQLARLYAHAWLVTGNDRYRTVAAETLDYLLREMRHPGGAFFSSQDADSEGVEGRFFTWSWDELVEVVGPEVAVAFGATPTGNWEGTNILHRSPSEGAALPTSAEMGRARRALFEHRERRVRPGTDDKVLAGWNAMAATALAEAGRSFGEPRYVEAAVRCAEFVFSQLRRPDGRLLRSWRDGVGGGPGYCDDYMLLVEACLTLYQSTYELRWFLMARSLADDALRLFFDEEHGGFFLNGADGESLLVRPKDLYDNAVPSGNSVAADVLQRIALLTGEAEYERPGVSALRLVRDVMGQAPTGFGHALCALDLYLGPSNEVAIIGEPSADATLALAAQATSVRFLPNVVVAVAAPDDLDAATAVALLRDRAPVNGRPTAFVCRRFACRLPVTEPEELAGQLAATP